MKFITDLKIYNFHLIVSYLGEGIDIIPIVDLRAKYFKGEQDYKKSLAENFNLNELTAKKHVLYGVQENTISRFELLKKERYHINNELILTNDISQISIDPNIDSLYAMSDQQGIIEVNIGNPDIPKKIKELIPKSFEDIGNPVLSNLVTKNNIIAISIRGYGINTIDNSSDKGNLQVNFRSSDPQDINLIGKNKYIIIADAFDGLIIYNEKTKEVEKKVKLPEDDFPQQVEIIYGNILIKGKKRLYLLHLNNFYLETLWESKIGALTKYYGYVIFSSQRKLVVFRLGHNNLKQKFSIDEIPEISKIELK